MKSKTKLRVLLLLCTIITLTNACKKDGGTEFSSYVKIKKDGVWTTYQGLGELGPDLANPTKTDLGISATSADYSFTFDISIQINGNNFTTGTYNTDTQTPWVLLSAMLGSNTGNLKHFSPEDVTGKPHSYYTVTITSITSTTISGTFAGNYISYTPGGGTPEVLNITEGEFKVNRVR